MLVWFIFFRVPEVQRYFCRVHQQQRRQRRRRWRRRRRRLRRLRRLRQQQRVFEPVSPSSANRGGGRGGSTSGSGEHGGIRQLFFSRQQTSQQERRITRAEPLRGAEMRGRRRSRSRGGGEASEGDELEGSSSGRDVAGGGLWYKTGEDPAGKVCIVCF